MSAAGPHSGENPGLNLPPPVEQGGERPPAAGVAENAPETAAPRPAGAERAPSSAAAGASAALPAIPLPPIDDNSGQSTQSDVSSTPKLASKSGSAKLIKDNDLIEKEWVDKAKRIVEKTRDDPHAQSDQLTGVKADYMKQQYNKTIKISK